MNPTLREDIRQMTDEAKTVRLTAVLSALQIPTMSRFRQPIPGNQSRRPGPTETDSQPLRNAVIAMAP